MFCFMLWKKSGEKRARGSEQRGKQGIHTHSLVTEKKQRLMSLILLLAYLSISALVLGWINNLKEKTRVVLQEFTSALLFRQTAPVSATKTVRQAIEISEFIMSPLDAQEAWQAIFNRWFLNASNVQQAGELIYEKIKSKDGENVFYFDGWDGFGASAGLRYIATMIPFKRTIPELCFGRIIFIDCSKWKNRRAVQRAIAEELKLDHSVMAILDKQDEEDDFKRIDESSRNAIGSVAQVIHQTLSATKFIMFFVNGSDNDIDVGTLGIPLTRFGKNVVIWTFGRSCLTMRHHFPNDIISKLRYTHVFLYSLIHELEGSSFRSLLHQQATTIVSRGPGMQDIDPTIVMECRLYRLFLHYNFHSIAEKLDWLSHASNYWICDAIIKGDRARDISNTLHGEKSWECDASLIVDVHKKLMEVMKHMGPPFLILKDGDVYEEGPYRWISVTSRNTELHGMQTIPAEASSFFLAFERSDHPPTLPNGLFENSSNLGVLVLCYCSFNFTSPPFHKCDNLRFLGLDRCTHKIGKEENHNHAEWEWLYNLLVLDLRYTDWDEILSEEKIDLMKNITELNIEGIRCWQYTAQLQGQLPNLQRLRIIRPTCLWETSNDVDDSFIDKTSMEILDLSGNSYMKIIPKSLSKASSLQMLILDGCDGLEDIIALGRLPPSLRSFSFDGYGPASQRAPIVELPLKHFRPSTVEDKKDISTSKISLEGCTKLDNMFLRGLNNLVELDLSGTAIKILDFKTMVVQVPRLKRLYLIGCKQLRAIIFLHGIPSSKVEPDLELMSIDTRAGIVCHRASIDKTKSFRLRVHAIVVDARLIHSVGSLTATDMKDVSYNIHVTSSPAYDGVVQFEETNNGKFDHCDQGSLEQLIPAVQYGDVLSMVCNPPMQAFPQPPATRLDAHIEIAKGSYYVESGLKGMLGYLMGETAESLHLHDVSIDAIIPRTQHYTWNNLRWCRVERCPKLDTVFPSVSSAFPSNSSGFFKLETFWASDLLMARWIWSKGRLHGSSSLSDTNSFKNLQHLHLRSCPRLQFVIPVWVCSFPKLETLHIIHCGDLVHVFELDELYPKEIFSLGVLFPKLTTMHLHDLPKLQQICEVNMVAPALESIKIRGCWSLRRLPSVAARARGARKPTIEIEKDVWDALEWDTDHRPDHFEAPVHSRYYKKKLPKVSFLR